MKQPDNHDTGQPRPDPPPDAGQGPAVYDRFVEISRDLFEKGQEKSAAAWEKSMELAREQLARAGEFSAEQGEQFKDYLRRDLAQTMTDLQQLGESTKDHLHPARLGAGMLSSLAKLLHAAGTLTCKACGQQVHLKATSMIPPCPSCHATRYRKSY